MKLSVPPASVMSAVSPSSGPAIMHRSSRGVAVPHFAQWFSPITPLSATKTKKEFSLVSTIAARQAVSAASRPG